MILFNKRSIRQKRNFKPPLSVVPIAFWICLHVNSALAIKENRIELLTSGGMGGLLVESLELSNHFTAVVEDENYFLKQKREQEPNSPALVKETLPLSWNLGAAYTLSSSPPPSSSASSITDHTISTAFGFNWEAGRRFETGLRLAIDYTSEESYIHGMALFGFEYTLCFGSHDGKSPEPTLETPSSPDPKTPPDPKPDELASVPYDPQDASQYYQQQYAHKMEEFEKYEKRIKSEASRSIASVSHSVSDNEKNDVEDEDGADKKKDDREEPERKFSFGKDQREKGDQSGTIYRPPHFFDRQAPVTEGADLDEN